MPVILPIVHKTLFLRSKSRILQKQGFKALISKAKKLKIVDQSSPF